MSVRSSLKIALNVALDALLAALAAALARWIAAPDASIPAWAIGAGAAALLIGGLPFGLSRQYWRFAGPPELRQLGASSMIAAVILAVVLRAAGVLMAAPVFPVAFALASFAILAMPRIAMQAVQMRPPFGLGADEPDGTALVAGAIEDADLFLRALAQERHPRIRVTGLLSPSSRQPGRRLQGRPILGTIDDAAAVLGRLQTAGRLPALLVLVSPDLLGDRLAALLEQADHHGVAVRRAPRVTALDLPERPARRLDLHPLAIEDLLNRPQVPLDREAMARLVQGRRVIVTGAGGTIGSELARQIAALGPELLVLLDNGEYALWQVDLELAEQHPAVMRQAMLADIRDQHRIRDIFERLRPEFVFHAAALKHVPMVEANPLDGLLTNVAGTRHVADAARGAGARAMVFISTDKAVNPTSVMGASKRLAEMYCQALDIAARAHGNGDMRCVTVRFGNVLGSTGSVVPLFQRQLARGGPLTVTHPDMRRYFMTVREAVGLVLEASVLGTDAAGLPDAQQGGIFVLDMGEPVKIVDLARQMIRLAGLRPDLDVPIRFTGLRPGEKLYEELFHGKEPPTPTGHPGLLMAAPRTADPAIVGRAIEELAASCRGGQERLALSLLGRLVPEFEHNAGGAVPMVTSS